MQLEPVFGHYVPMATLHHQINDCIEKLKSGQLVEDDLRALLTSVDQRHRRKQSLLYIQTSSTRPEGEVVGMSIFEDGKDPDGIDTDGNFLYQTLEQAMDDGWRIIKFPELTMVYLDPDYGGMKWEFVLEK